MADSLKRFQLRFKITGSGWAEVSVDLDGQTINMTASYLTDAVAEMAGCAIAVLNGAMESRFSLDDEPGESRWIVRSHSGDNIQVTILWFDELWTNEPDDRGKLLIEFETTRIKFGRQVDRVLYSLRESHSDSGYKIEWGHDFPVEKHDQLKKLLSSI